MYLHIGQDYIINTKDVIGVFDLDTASTERRTREFLARAEKEGAVVTLSGDLPRSFVLTDFPDNTIYLSPLSSRALEHRAANTLFPQDY